MKIRKLKRRVMRLQGEKQSCWMLKDGRLVMWSVLRRRPEVRRPITFTFVTQEVNVDALRTLFMGGLIDHSALKPQYVAALMGKSSDESTT